MPVPGSWTWGEEGGGSSTSGSEAGWEICGEGMWADGGARRKDV